MDLIYINFYIKVVLILENVIKIIYFFILNWLNFFEKVYMFMVLG